MLLAAPALAETRVALVIGNSAYKHAPALANPKNDAEGMAASLRRLKFEVLAGTDLDKPAMEKLLQAFAAKLETADVALVFYAGHGLQVHGRNYLVPVDGKLDRESDLAFQAVPLDLIQGLMEQSQRTNIMILDACRDNPLARNLARTMGTRSVGIGRGLGETKAGIGTLIVYATQPGNVALDGEGRNSPFTASLLKHIEAPGLEIRQVLTRVRNDVITATRDKQVPWDSSSLRGDFFFAAAPAARETPPAETKPGETKPPVTESPPRTAPDGEIVFWQSIQNSKSAADYKAYLEKYPNGTFAALAKLRIAEIEKATVVTPTKPAPEKPAPQPAPPRRTSTFQPGVQIHQYIHLGQRQKAATVQACQARCLANHECTAWSYINERHWSPEFRGDCILIKVVQGQRVDEQHHSGVIRTTPVAAPAPTAPKAQPGPIKRTSSFEPGTFIDGVWADGTVAIRVASAQACQARCLGHPQCVAWKWYNETAGANAQFCHVYSSESSRSKSDSATSGAIRTSTAR
jgi:uncharacterized caspase-like protein